MEEQNDIAVGQRFGRLVVQGPTQPGKRTLWNVLCDCGTARSLRATKLRSGHTRSCGCLRREAAKARSTTHGRSDTPLYVQWAGMHNRCLNASTNDYESYGGRGIKVCERWSSFENFLADMGERPSAAHSLDRINSDGHYDPGNVRWATEKEQQRNRRNLHQVEIDGVTKCVSEWCEIFGTPRSRAFCRLARGWSPADAVMLAKQPKGRKAVNFTRNDS